MPQALRHHDIEPDPVPTIVGMLRIAALECRVAARGAVTACATIDPDTPAGDIMTVLATALPRMMDMRPIIWRPGTDGMSFDEQWLAAVSAALERGDRASVRFLLARRVRADAISPMMHLLTCLNRALGQLENGDRCLRTFLK